MANSEKYPWLWWSLLLATGVSSIIFGRAELFKDTYCPALIFPLLYLSGGIMVLATAWRAYVDTTLGRATPISTFLSLVIVFFVIVAIPSLVGIGLHYFPSAKDTLCPSCTQDLNTAKRLRVDENYKGAELLVRPCYQQTRDPVIKKEAAALLIRILIDRSADELGKNNCELALRDQKEAEAIVRQYFSGDDLEVIADQNMEKYELICKQHVLTSTAIPYTRTIQIIRPPINGVTMIALDFRIFENVEQVTDLTRADVQIHLNGRTIPIVNFIDKGADEPVCIVAALDNSGSVRPNLEEIHRSVESLNDMRKPRDELGQVIFGRFVKTVDEPKMASIDPESVDGSENFTRIWDGIAEAIKLTGQCRSTNRYVIVVTDGIATGSNSFTPERIFKLAQDMDVSLCPIGVKSKDLNEVMLQSIVNQCDYYTAENFESLATHFQLIYGETRGFYRVEFESSYVSTRPTVLSLKVAKAREVEIELK